MTKKEFARARAWRESLELSQSELGKLIGYAQPTIYWFERGETPTHGKGQAETREIAPWVWQRYKMACAGLAAQIKRKQEFDW